MTKVTFDRRFRGPPDSANGGYFAGMLARELGGTGVVITLRRPAPLDVELETVVDRASASLVDGKAVLATAERASVDVDVPAPPSLDEARAAEARFAAAEHIYPGCFVCGPGRAAGDGWRIFPGPTGPGRVAASWTAAAEFADDNGHVRSEFVWAALDCPGYFAVAESAGLALLGRIGVVVNAPVPAGEPLIVQGWAVASEGRKHHAATALHDARGGLLAASAQTWISLG